MSQTLRNAAAQLPKTRDRPVTPKFLAVRHFVKFRNAHAVCIWRHMFRHYVHRNFAKVKVRPDSRRRRNACRFEYVANHFLRQFPCRFLIQRKIMRQVDKAFVDRIDVNIFFAHIFQINFIDAGRILHILRHLWLCYQELDLLARAPFHLAHLLIYLEQARTSGNAIRFEAWSHGKTNRLFRTARIRNHKIRRQRVKPAKHTLHRRKKRLQVNRNISTCFARQSHKMKYRTLLH